MIYAGIDEAGYGPILGPLVVGRTVFELTDGQELNLWERMPGVLCKRLAGRKGRLPINDSKKLKTKAAGIEHLERGVLAFGKTWKPTPDNLAQWLTQLGETTLPNLKVMPWYANAGEPFPAKVTADDLAVTTNPLRHALNKEGVTLRDMGAAVVCEDRFNRMVQATRSKASVSFTFVAGHLQHIWNTYASADQTTVMVDRQSGRTRYLSLLRPLFPQAQVTILEETPQQSSYQFVEGDRQMAVHFLVEAEEAHLPVALASMICKYTRELFMARLNLWFQAQLPDLKLKPTAGYALDGKRFLKEVEPFFGQLNIDQLMFVRQS